jgi:hypothetical protein
VEHRVAHGPDQALVGFLMKRSSVISGRKKMGDRVVPHSKPSG